MTTSLNLILLYLASLLCKPNNNVNIYYDDSIKALTNCKENFAEFKYYVFTNVNEVVKLYSFDLGQIEFEIYNNNKKISKSDTCYFDSRNPITLKFRYSLNTNRPSMFKFATNNDLNTVYNIPITYGDVDLTIPDIKKTSQHIFNISKSCNDSLRIHFEEGGTSTSITLYKFLNHRKKEFINSIQILDGSEIDYFIFTKKDIGRYFISYSSCHWRKKIWLKIK